MISDGSWWWYILPQGCPLHSSSPGCAHWWRCCHLTLSWRPAGSWGSLLSKFETSWISGIHGMDCRPRLLHEKKSLKNISFKYSLHEIFHNWIGFVCSWIFVSIKWSLISCWFSHIWIPLCRSNHHIGCEMAVYHDKNLIIIIDTSVLIF